MVATASTEYPIGYCLQPIGCSVEAVATMIGCFPTQAIAFGWKPGFSVLDRQLVTDWLIEVFRTLIIAVNYYSGRQAAPRATHCVLRVDYLSFVSSLCEYWTIRVARKGDFGI